MRGTRYSLTLNQREGLIQYQLETKKDWEHERAAFDRNVATARAAFEAGKILAGPWIGRHSGMVGKGNR